MKRSKLSENQVITLLNDAEAGLAIGDLCRKYKISSATFYKLKSKYVGMTVSSLKRLKELEQEGNLKRKLPKKF